MRLTGAFMTLCALVACGEGRQASLATPVLSYNGSHPFPAVIGESIALTPAVSGTVGHYTVSPPLPPGLSLDGQSGVISGTPTQARGSATYTVNASGAGMRVWKATSSTVSLRSVRALRSCCPMLSMAQIKMDSGVRKLKIRGKFQPLLKGGPGR